MKTLGRAFLLWTLASLALVAPGDYTALASDREPAFPTVAPTVSPAASNATLANEQELLARRYHDFELLVQNLAASLRATDPDRAALLEQVFGQAKRDLLETHHADAIEALRRGNWQGATAEQQQLMDAMNRLLELLLAEDRASRLKEQRQKLERALQDLDKLTLRQKDLRARTERESDELPNLRAGQQRLGEDTAQLGHRLHEEHRPSSEKAGDSGRQGEPAKEGKGSPKTPAEDRHNQGEGKPGDQDPTAEAQSELRQAKQAMDQAGGQLDKGKRAPASEAQDEAVTRLQQAAAQIRETLRQWREEERLQRLQSLEARCQKMLELQQSVHEATLQADRIPLPQRTEADKKKIKAFATRQEQVVTEANQALTLLAEDGTSAAFPIAFEQIRDDGQRVVEVLQRGQTDLLAQALQKQIIAALEEMIASLQREVRAAHAGQSKSPGGTAPLVDQLAELRLIRSLQRRVVERTAQVAEGKLGPVADLAPVVRDLADRQTRVYQITRELLLRKDQ